MSRFIAQSYVCEYSHQYIAVLAQMKCILVGVAVDQMEQVAVSAFHKAAEGRVDESLQRVTEAQQKCHLPLPT